jgi:hypothetical protein
VEVGVKFTEGDGGGIVFGVGESVFRETALEKTVGAWNHWPRFGSGLPVSLALVLLDALFALLNVLRSRLLDRLHG